MFFLKTTSLILQALAKPKHNKNHIPKTYEKNPVLFILLVTTFFLSRQLGAVPEGGGGGGRVSSHVEEPSRATTVKAAGTKATGTTTATAYGGRTTTEAAAEHIKANFYFANAVTVSRANLGSAKTASLLASGKTIRTETAWGSTIFCSAKNTTAQRHL